MEETLSIKLVLSLLVLLLLVVAVKTFYSLVWVPRRLEKHIKQQRVKGTSYTFLYGDMKEYVKMMKVAWAKPMNLTHHIAPRVVPFVYNTVQLYGKVSLIWTGKTPRLIILVPELMQEILADKNDHFRKPPINALILILSRGLASLEGKKWAKHRKIINPAFQMEKLKGMVPAISTSCYELVQHWNTLVGNQGFCEVDIWSEFENLTGDIISRTAFGSSFKEGKRIFQLQKEQATLVIEAMLSLYIPGFRKEGFIYSGGDVQELVNWIRVLDGIHESADRFEEKWERRLTARLALLGKLPDAYSQTN
ncbi:Cytochrome p450 [Thalictrum thalictroides]|uniref:Cytochrome p450 n=1 Tax=Thalictrum thalictroides TaxID=46969 RepID=A0A7J6V7K7_THATH|nr:Cytochrome p450 [Thalictrum thalictroides]